MSELNDALADVKQEGETLAEVLKDPVTDSPSVEKPKEDEPTVAETTAEGDNTPTAESVPFHKHPRWIERESELKELRERDEARAKEIDELKATQERNTPVTLPEWFKELYGENEQAFTKYNEHEQQRTQEIEKAIVQRLEDTKKQELDAANRWNKWVEDEISKLHADGKQFDRNKLIKTMLEYRPTDERGNFDFQKGYRIYEAMEPKADAVDPAKSQARKQLGDITGSTKGDKKAKDYLTPHDLRNKSWANL